jgi:hypothetical protein
MTEDGLLIGGIAAAALFLDFIIHMIAGTWVLARSRESLGKELSNQLKDQARDFLDQIKEQRKKVDQDLTGLRKELSETFAAMRQSMENLGKDTGRIELESYKNFVRRDSFYEVLKGQNELVSEQIKKLSDKVDKLDEFTRDITRVPKSV